LIQYASGQESGQEPGHASVEDVTRGEAQ